MLTIGIDSNATDAALFVGLTIDIAKIVSSPRGSGLSKANVLHDGPTAATDTSTQTIQRRDTTFPPSR
jgi:hypothetical protein